MKYLFTGFYPGTVREDPTLNIRTGRVALTAALRELGHEVVYQNPLKLDGDYDAAVVVLFPTFTFNARYSMGIFNLVINNPVRKFFLLDDWRVMPIFTDYNRGIRLASCKYDEKRFHVLGHLGDYIPGLPEKFYHRMCEEPIELMYPAYSVGDHCLIERHVTKVNRSATFSHFDPSNAFPVYDVTMPNPEDRRRAWVEANLGSDHSDVATRYHLDWPVDLYGGRRKDALPRITEDRLAQVYADNWGLVSYPYTHAGSGWWRNRYNMAADNWNVLAAHPADLEAFGFNSSLPKIAEGKLSTSGLMDLATLIRTQLRNAFWPREAFMGYVRKTLVEPLL